MERAFKQFCNYNMHQPFRVFFTEGASVGTTDNNFQRMTAFLESSDSQFLVTVQTHRISDPISNQLHDLLSNWIHSAPT